MISVIIKKGNLLYIFYIQTSKKCTVRVLNAQFGIAVVGPIKSATNPIIGRKEAKILHTIVG